jgi:hypothetical protein
LSQKKEGIFNIQAKAIQGIILNFTNVDGYEVEPGDFVTFKDPKTGDIKRFHSSNCEIKEVKVRS